MNQKETENSCLRQQIANEFYFILNKQITLLSYFCILSPQLISKMENNSKPQGWGVRHTFLILTFILMFMNQCWRSNLSVAIVAMVKHGKSNRRLIDNRSKMFLEFQQRMKM